MTLDAFLNETREQLEHSLQASFAQSQSDHLTCAAQYSLLNGGKRLRPALVRAAAELFGCNDDRWLSAACAIEMIHVYSLIHDDLPAMDDDDTRHGKDANHIKFDDATAILAGDALQTEAFLLLSNSRALNAEQARAMMSELAKAAGASGMVAGQMIDLLSENKSITLDELANLHRLKTGALIQCALTMGSLCGESPSQANRLKVLQSYGSALGLLYQIVDDILDVTSSSDVLGKPQGSDEAAQKTTYISLLGLDGAKEKAAHQHQLAIHALTELGQTRQNTLWQLADYVLNRSY